MFFVYLDWNFKGELVDTEKRARLIAFDTSARVLWRAVFPEEFPFGVGEGRIPDLVFFFLRRKDSVGGLFIPEKQSRPAGLGEDGGCVFKVFQINFFKKVEVVVCKNKACDKKRQGGGESGQ